MWRLGLDVETEMVFDTVLPEGEKLEMVADPIFAFSDFMPHWDSDHPESADIEKEITYCKENNISYKAIRDGEVIIIE